MKSKTKVGSLILAGGSSTRMGYPKPYLIYNNKTFIDHLIDAYHKSSCEKTVVVLNKNFYTPAWHRYIDVLFKKASFIINPWPEAGRFYSIKMGMESFEDFDYCLIQNIDNPFTDPALIDELIENKNPKGYTVPVYNNTGGHPVLVARNIIEKVNAAEELDTNFKTLLHQFDRKEVRTDRQELLYNVNTPEDYEKYCSGETVMNDE